MRNKTIQFILFLLISNLCFSQQVIEESDKAAKLNQLIKETQSSKSETGTMRIGWWFPYELWETIIDLDPSTTDQDKSEMKSIIRPYTFFAVAHGKMNDSSDPYKMNLVYSDKESIAKSLTLKGNDGKTYKPLDEKELDYQVQVILELFTPIFSNMMGDLGKNFHFYVFFDRRGSLPRISDPKIKGEVSFQAENIVYKFMTPLPSLVPDKQCPVDKDLMNGTWNYCPLHGNELLIVTD
jgi:hypothetical protein